MIIRVGELVDELISYDRNKMVEVVATTILSPEQQIEILQKHGGGCIGGTIRSVEENDAFVIIHASDS